jgi:hypothetical protein
MAEARIRVIHPGPPETYSYYYWSGFGPVRSTPTGFGSATDDFIPLVEKTEAEFALIQNTAAGWWTTDLSDIADAVNS